MEDSKKKPILIAIVVICLILAAVITFRRSSTGGSGTFDTLDASEMMWVKCDNESCGAEYEMGMKDFYTEKSTSDEEPVCKECGSPSLYAAYKCPKCGVVFFKGSIPNDYSDRCPECDFSQKEENRKK